jgi:hypothetical protein
MEIFAKSVIICPDEIRMEKLQNRAGLSQQRRREWLNRELMGTANSRDSWAASPALHVAKRVMAPNVMCTHVEECHRLECYAVWLL